MNRPPKISFDVLHVIVLSGSNGENAGPVKVAREICAELANRNYRTHILTGVRDNSIPDSEPNFTFLRVKSMFSKYPVSSLWSWKASKRIYSLVKSSRLVHIHFGRDLISLTTAVMCIFLKRPFLIQTHGMVTPDSRKVVRFLDQVLTRPLANLANYILYLTENERLQFEEMKFTSEKIFVPNGIKVSPLLHLREENSVPRVVFCSRINEVKGVDKFLEIAKWANSNDCKAKFEIYGPDDGALSETLEAVHLSNIQHLVFYGGAISPNDISNFLQQVDLLILPSSYDPYPMIVLESLSVGTPVLISPLCGHSQKVRDFNQLFVAEVNETESYCRNFKALYDNNFFKQERSNYIEKTIETFGISSVVDKIENLYKGD